MWYSRYARAIALKNFQGLGQCLSGHYHHKLVKNSLFLTNWSPVLLTKKVTCSEHSIHCNFVLSFSSLSQKNSRATWLFYCYFILLGPQGVSKPPKRILSFMAFFSTLNWIIDEQLEEHFLWLPSFKYWPALEKMKLFYRQRFWMEIRVHLFYNKF